MLNAFRSSGGIAAVLVKRQYQSGSTALINGSLDSDSLDSLDSLDSEGNVPV